MLQLSMAQVKILILGDVMGSSGRKAVKNNLSKLIKDETIDFTVINGENAADVKTPEKY